ncbi:MAG: LamG domain-containing protein, partial [Sedimentisphaerales bacterium]|nr:LamG domain-containing protein [Sedimentisphaerales bacterium]
NRMFLMAGTQDDPYLAPDGVNTAPVGVLNLNDDGKKLFLNAMKYLIPAKPVDPGTDNLVAYYPLDGDTLDASGNGLDGTIMGDPNFVEGIIGMGLQLDGVDDYVDCGNNPLFDITEQITLATWVNVNDFGNGQHNPWVSKGDHSYCLKGCRTGNAIEFDVYESGWKWINAEVGAINNEWHHAAGTFDGAQLKVYLDGELISTKDVAPGIATSVHNVAIGTNTEASGRFSEGIQDEVRIYNRALTAEEILYIAGM